MQLYGSWIIQLWTAKLKSQESRGVEEMPGETVSSVMSCQNLGICHADL